jgi:hypothetical protein
MSEPNNLDPKALEAVAKIRAILTEYDLWGVIGVGSTERFHWTFHVDPSWSCIYINQETGEVRIRAKRADFASADDHKHVISNTVGALNSTRDYAALLFEQMDRLVEVMKRNGIDFTHESFKDMRLGRPQKN